MITKQDIRDQFPEFDCVSNGVVDLAIEEAECAISDCFGETRDLAMKYIVAHELTLRMNNSSGGIVTSEKIGDLSRSYSVDTSDSDAYYRQTQFGLKFLNMRDSIVTTPFLID